MLRELHICHVSSTFDVGGAQVRTATIINALGSKFAHTIMAMDGGWAALQKIEPGIVVRPLPPPRRAALYPLALYNSIRAVKPDLVVTYNWGAIEATLGARMGSIAPVIHLEDGFGADEADGLKLRRVVARRAILNRIYRTVVPSKTLLNIALNQYRIRPDRVKFIPNGVDVRKFRPERDGEFRRRLGIAEETILFGYVGQLRAEKNLGFLLRAFAAARLPNAQLIIVGDGPCGEELRRVARELGISNRVIQAGSTNDPGRYYAALDVFVMSSTTEQMPLSLLEAMACGLPAICTDVGDTRDLLGASQPPAVNPPGDVATYAESLGALAQAPAWRAALGAANRTRCIAQYSLDQMIHEYEGLYYAAIGSGRTLSLAALTQPSNTVKC